MQQVEHRILAALVVAGGGIDGHTALHLQRGAVVPYFREVAVGHLVYLIQIALVTLLVADDEDVGERYDVAVHVDVGRILHTCQSVDVERVTVQFRSKFIGGVTPHTVLTLLQLSHAWGIILAIARDLNRLGGQEVTSHFHLACLGGEEVESHGSIAVDNGGLYVGTVEEFLLCRSAYAAHCCKGKC